MWSNHTLLSYYPNMYPRKTQEQPFLRYSAQDEIGPALIDAPYSYLINRYLTNLQLPLWNSYSALGYPLAADLQSSAFIPYHLPTLLGIKFWDFFLILRPFFAMLCLFLFLKELKLNTVSSLIGGFLFGFSGYFSYFLNNFHLSIEMWLPACLLFIRKYLSKQSLFNISLLILIYYFLYNSNNPQSTILGLLFVNSYFLFEVIFNHKITRKKYYISFLIFINLIGLGLNAYKYLPFIELLNNSWTIHQGNIQLVSMTGLGLSNFIFPYLTGYLRGEIINNIKSTQILPYFGILPTWFALNSLLSRKYHRYIMFFFFVILFWLLVLTKSWIITPILKLPILSMIWFNKYNATLFLSASILSAIGTNLIIEKKINRFFPLIFAFILLFVWIFVSTYNGLTFNDILSVPKLINSTFISLYASNRNVITNAFFQWEKLFILSTIIFSLAYIIDCKKKLHIYFYRFLLLLFLIFFIFETYLYFPKIRAHQFNPSKNFEFVDFLSKDKSLYRIYGIQQTIIPQQNLYYGLNDIRLVSPLIYKRYADFVRKILVKQPVVEYYPFLGSSENDLKKINNKFLSMINTKYILSDKYIPLDINYNLIYDKEIKIYLNKNVFPRAYLINNIIKKTSMSEIFTEMERNSFDPSKTAIIENFPLPESVLNIPNQINNKKSSVEITSYDPTKVVIKVNLNLKSLLVLSDLYYPGLDVFIDKTKSVIYPVNYISRGVVVDEGTHIVEFVYKPKSFKFGVIISLFSLFCLIIFYLKKYKHSLR